MHNIQNKVFGTVLLAFVMASNVFAGPMPVRLGCSFIVPSQGSDTMRLKCGEEHIVFQKVVEMAISPYQNNQKQAIYFIMENNEISKYGFDSNWLVTGVLKEHFHTVSYDYETHGKLVRVQ